MPTLSTIFLCAFALRPIAAGQDADASGLILSGRRLFDPDGQPLGEIAAEVPGEVIQSCFAGDGGNVILITRDGKIVTLNPGR